MRIMDSTRKLDRRGLRAAEQLETELLLAEVDDLADQGRGIGLRECQDPINIVGVAGDRIRLTAGGDIPGELAILPQGQFDAQVGHWPGLPGTEEGRRGRGWFTNPGRVGGPSEVGRRRGRSPGRS